MKKRNEVSLANKFHYLALAIDEIAHSSRKPRTDVIGIACQYSSQPKLKREDFEGILDMTIGNIIEHIKT